MDKVKLSEMKCSPAGVHIDDKGVREHVKSVVDALNDGEEETSISSGDSFVYGYRHDGGEVTIFVTRITKEYTSY